MKIISVLIIFAVLLFGAMPGNAAENIGLTGEEFLMRLANVFFRVRFGFSNCQVMKAEYRDDSILLNYNNAVFLLVRETPPPREVKNISVVYITQQCDAAESLKRDGVSNDSIVFENVCEQVMYALHLSIKDTETQNLKKGLGMTGELLDGVQRSACFEGNRYIVKYNKNGMLMMVVSSI